MGLLELDGTEVVEGTSPGSLKQLNVPNILYIGEDYVVFIYECIVYIL